jgi:hypothetical protein
MQAEMVTRVVCDVVRGALPPHRGVLRSATGERWWPDGLTDDVLERGGTRLRGAAADWAALSPGVTLTLRWDHRVDAALAAPTPPRAIRRFRDPRTGTLAAWPALQLLPPLLSLSLPLPVRR